MEEALEARDSAEPWTGREAEHTVSAGSAEGPGRACGLRFRSASGAHGEAEPGAGVCGSRARAGCLLPQSALAGGLAVGGAGVSGDGKGVWHPGADLLFPARKVCSLQKGRLPVQAAQNMPCSAQRRAVPGPGDRWVKCRPREASSCDCPAPPPRQT